MSADETKSGSLSFALVVYIAIAAIIVIFVAVIIVGRWRANAKHKPPYTGTPTAQFHVPRGVATVGAGLDSGMRIELAA